MRAANCAALIRARRYCHLQRSGLATMRRPLSARAGCALYPDAKGWVFPVGAAVVEQSRLSALVRRFAAPAHATDFELGVDALLSGLRHHLEDNQ